MPKVAGLNIVAILIATLVFYFIGFIWYGVIFNELWVSLMGLTPADLAELEKTQGLSMGFGFLNTFVTVIVIAIIARWAADMELVTFLIRIAVFWIGLALTSLAYGPIYGGTSILMLIIDGAHLLLGYLAAATILKLMK